MAAVARGNVGLLRSAPNFIVTEQQGRMLVAKPREPHDTSTSYGARRRGYDGSHKVVSRDNNQMNEEIYERVQKDLSEPWHGSRPKLGNARTKLTK